MIWVLFCFCKTSKKGVKNQ